MTLSELTLDVQCNVVMKGKPRDTSRLSNCSIDLIEEVS